MQNSSKDYWKISSRNFIALAILLICFQIYSYIGYSQTMNQLGNPDQTLPLSEFTFPLIMVAVLLAIGSLFRKHNRLAIYLAYILIGVGLVINIAVSLNVLAVLLCIYVLFFVYKAQKNP